MRAAAADPVLLAVLERSYTTTEMDAMSLRRKNKAMLDAAIAESKEAEKNDRTARLVEEQTRAVLAACSNSSDFSHANYYAGFELLRLHRPFSDAKGKGQASRQ